MYPLFIDEVNQYMIEDRVRSQHAALALQTRRNTGRSRARIRTAFGVRLVRLGLRLVTTEGSPTPALVTMNGRTQR